MNCSTGSGPTAQHWCAGERDVLDSEELRVTLDAGDSGDELVSSDSSGSDDDGERAAAKYETMVETYLDRQYESYLQRKHARDAIKAEKQRRARLGVAGVGDGARRHCSTLPTAAGTHYRAFLEPSAPLATSRFSRRLCDAGPPGTVRA